MRQKFEVTAVHPALREVHSRVGEMIENPTGMIADSPVLLAYLGLQWQVLGVRDAMLAYDYVTLGRPDANNLIEGEFWELLAELSWWNKAAREVGVEAGMEAGDLAWFIAMRYAQAVLRPSEMVITRDERIKYIGMLGVIDKLAKEYPESDPSKFVDRVGRKNEGNFPDRCLRQPDYLEPAEMGRVFAKDIYPALRRVRRGLGSNLTRGVVAGIQSASTDLPSELEGKGVDGAYRVLVDGAKVAGLYYDYHRV